MRDYRTHRPDVPLQLAHKSNLAAISTNSRIPPHRLRSKPPGNSRFLHCRHRRRQWPGRHQRTATGTLAKGGWLDDRLMRPDPLAYGGQQTAGSGQSVDDRLMRPQPFVALHCSYLPRLQCSFAQRSRRGRKSRHERTRFRFELDTYKWSFVYYTPCPARIHVHISPGISPGLQEGIPQIKGLNGSGLDLAAASPLRPLDAPCFPLPHLTRASAQGRDSAIRQFFVRDFWQFAYGTPRIST